MEGLSIENFRGDADNLERMAHIAWRDEYGQDSYPNLYRPDYLAYLLQGVSDPRLTLAAYQGDEMVGFLANLPRTMALDGKDYRAALSCLLVVRKQFFRQGLAQALIQEALKRNRELRFDFTLFYLETGHRSRRLFTKLQQGGMPIERVKTMHVIGRVLDLGAVRASEKVKAYEVAAMKLLAADRPPTGATLPLREARLEDADQLLAYLNSHRQKVRLARVFERDEMIRELLHPPLAHTLVAEKNGEVSAAIAYVIIDHVGKSSVPWAWINHLVWDRLRFRERVAFLRSFLQTAAGQGCAGVVEWSKQVYPTAALYAAHFVPYPRRVDMMSWRFRDDISLSAIPDVYEVQI